MSSPEETRDPVVTVRMPEEPLSKQLPEYRAVNLTRSTLVRFAVAHGLERLRAGLEKRVDEELQVDLPEPKQSSLI